MHHLKLRNPHLRLRRLVAIYFLVLLVAGGLTGEIILHQASHKLGRSSAGISSQNTALTARSMGTHATTCNLSPVLPQTGKVFVGVTTSHAGWSMNGVTQFSRETGVQPSLVMFYSGWGGKPAFNAVPFQNIHNAGMMPMLDWEPWNYQAPSAQSVDLSSQSAFSDASLMSGTYRNFIKAWAVGIKNLGFPVALNFAHEMNGNWYPWAASVNGNSPASFVALWRYVHDIFAQVGANNVVWVWSPNVSYPGSIPLASLWPGSNYVNWAGAIGYFWGTSNPSPPSFSVVFGPTFAQIQSITTKPIIIAETSGSNSSGQKVQWLESFFRGLSNYPQIVGFTWFDIKKHHNWTVNSSPSALAAFKTGLSTISLVTSDNSATAFATTTSTSPHNSDSSGHQTGSTCKQVNNSLDPLGTKSAAPIPPNPPSSVSARVQNSAALVSWSAPHGPNLAAITGYIVTPYIGAVAQTPVIFKSTSTIELITGLTNGISYAFKVAAISSAGVSANSAPSAPTMLGVLPDPPSGIAAKAQNSAALVSWSAPHGPNLAAITGYIVTPYVGAVAQTPVIFKSTSTIELITGLTNGISYAFKVAAISSAGVSANSAPTNSIAPFSAAKAPNLIQTTLGKLTEQMPNKSSSTANRTASVLSPGNQFTSSMKSTRP